ncbi:MAG: FHA domain-containing protein [Acidobacteriaceae bacterium]
MDVEIELEGTTNRWVLSQSRIRIGGGSRCDVILPPEEYPSVASEHAVLDIANGLVMLAAGRGTDAPVWMNNHLMSGNTVVHSGDVLRLGPSGPTLKITVVDRVKLREGEVRTRATISAEKTVIAAAPGSRVDRTDRPTEMATVMAASPMDGAANPARQAKSQGVRVRFGQESGAEAAAPAVPTTSKAPVAPAGAGGDVRMIEKKLDTMRNLLAANLVVLVLLLFGLFYESQQINQNRVALEQMRMQAQTAMGQFTPSLDARLNVFETRMDGMDAKMQAAEDHMVQRMNAEVPAMMDQYLKRKEAELKRQAPAGIPVPTP